MENHVDDNEQEISDKDVSQASVLLNNRSLKSLSFQINVLTFNLTPSVPDQSSALIPGCFKWKISLDFSNTFIVKVSNDILILDSIEHTLWVILVKAVARLISSDLLLFCLRQAVSLYVRISGLYYFIIHNLCIILDTYYIKRRKIIFQT